MRSGRSALMAEAYGLDKPVDAEYPDVRYYATLLAGYGGRALELAAGTGRFLVPLRDAGVAVDGLDHSAEMLDICHEHCRARGHDPRLYVGDMVDFTVDDRYDLVLVLSGAIKELDGRQAALDALRCIRRCLVPGGTVYIDLVPPRHVSGSVSPSRPTEPGPAQSWRLGREMWTMQTMQLHYDSAANRTTQLLRYEKWCDAALVATEAHTFVIQHWTLWEFEQLMLEAGFVDLTVTANYRDGQAPGPADDDWTFRATSP